MTITCYDFHHMIGLRVDGVLISVEDELGVWSGAELLGRRYATKTICYTDLEVDFMHRPQGTAEECLQMARAFLLFLLGAYLFTNGGQTVSLRWLAIFRDFERSWAANWRTICLAYLYSSLDTLSQGTLCQLVGPWKLIKVSFFIFSLVVHAFSFLVIHPHAI